MGFTVVPSVMKMLVVYAYMKNEGPIYYNCGLLYTAHLSRPPCRWILLGHNLIWLRNFKGV